MHFIVLYGPPAVGKMAVGSEIERTTGIKLFHNHMTIEWALQFFDFGTEAFHGLVDSMREHVFTGIASGNSPGLIFTYVWDLDSDADRGFIAAACETFVEQGAHVTLVELSATLDERLHRNRAPERLAEKPSKRNVARSEANLLALENYTLNGKANGLPYEHVAIDTTKLTALQTATTIIEALELDPR